MTSLLGTLFLSLFASLGLIPCVRILARSIGLVDRPDGHRKIHSRITPLAGGPALLIATVFASSVAFTYWYPLEHFASAWLGLLLGATFICGLGIVDDLGYLRGRHKLLGQIVAASIVVLCGVQVERVELLGWHGEFGIFAAPFTIFLLLGAINSLNLLDGMDGLLGTISLIVTFTVATLAFVLGDLPTALVAAALAGSILGFLRYNLPPASVFLGDSGSMLIGLIVGTLAIIGGLKGPTTLVLSTPLVLLTLPVFDTTAAIVRRKLTGRSIYNTDRGHLHHCLLRHGFSNWAILRLVTGICVLTGFAVLAGRLLEQDLLALCTFIGVISVLIATRLFGYAEALLLRKRMFGLGTSLLQRPEVVPVKELEVRLQGVFEWRILWSQLIQTAMQQNIQRLRLDVNAPALHEGYHARWELRIDEDEVSNLWRVELPLSVESVHVGRLEVAGVWDESPLWQKIVAISEVMDQFQHRIVLHPHHRSAVLTRSEHNKAAKPVLVHEASDSEAEASYSVIS